LYPQIHIVIQKKLTVVLQADFVLLQRKLEGFLTNPNVGLVLAPYEIQTFLALYDDYFGLNGKILIRGERDGYLSTIVSLPRFSDTYLNAKIFFSIMRDPETCTKIGSNS
jgi:hypothetical protein